MGKSRSEIKGTKRKRSRIFKSIIFIILLFVLLGGGYGAYAFSNIYHAAEESYKPIDRDKSQYRDENVTIGKNPISILLMGVEDYSTNGKDGRTDTLIVATLNPQTKKMMMISIPRDTRVPIASKDNQLDKINAAYSSGSVNGYGAEKSTIETVENFLHIPIDYYVKVGFKGFVDVVDEIGGVKVDVPFDFWEKNIYDHNKHINFTKGPMQLNGEEALAYVRMRKRDPRGDFGRNDRQRQVIEAAISQMKSADMLFKVDDLSDIVGKNIQTNLKPSEIYSLEKQYSNVTPAKQKFTLDTAEGHGSNDTINGIYYYAPDENYVSEITAALRKQLGLSPYTGSDTGTATNTDSSTSTDTDSTTTINQ
ncbi:LCP family protein required for cell wall assembly [Pullulanibacillus pueri]|uniref:LytR family transcriptional regulator n=1 Tax=Pullulanibacillus pueri TaxID=1437324 RepID=A0A8J2ZUA6_9BACL|nr:LCP family protein [Pullulanibacillus pueri]MBM7683635.1 LCP family protein required for cell wall assembly [Pullulanibacillus pueri]GGH76640.1 LytR family transcriptional regulator [Pullulanibacillus pueri]